MNLKIESNAFTKLDEMVGTNNVEILLGEYTFENLSLKGNVIIKGDYYDKNIEGTKEFKNEIPYEIVFTKEEPIINKIEISNFEFYEVVGRGIESSFNIIVDYNFNDVINNREVIEKSEDTEIEDIKDSITEQVDQLLAETMEVIDDNFLEENIVLEERKTEKIAKKDPSTVIKVIYYKEGDMVKELCKKHNLSYEKVLLDNSKYESLDSHRIIVRETNGYN